MKDAPQQSRDENTPPADPLCASHALFALGFSRQLSKLQMQRSKCAHTRKWVHPDRLCLSACKTVRGDSVLGTGRTQEGESKSNPETLTVSGAILTGVWPSPQDLRQVTQQHQAGTRPETAPPECQTSAGATH